MAHILINPTTAAVNDVVKVKVSGPRIPATLMATGLQGVEDVLIKFSIDDGVTWQDLYIDEVQARLTAQNNTMAIYSPMIIGVTKPITASPVGVAISVVDNV